MAFAYTVTTSPAPGPISNLDYISGTYTNVSSGTGGAIVTGMNVLSAFGICPSAADATVPYATASGGTLTVGCANTASGIWWAIGK